MKGMGVDVKLKKTPSLTKKNISLDISKKNATPEKRTSSAKKLIGSLWDSFKSPKEKQDSSSKKSRENLKIKENSLEKHNRLRDFFD